MPDDHLYLAAVEEYEQEAENTERRWQAAADQLLFNERLEAIKKALRNLVAKARDVIPDDGMFCYSVCAR